jgi:hypothetical protein
MTTDRTLPVAYVPTFDLAKRWPDWTVHETTMVDGSTERFYPDSRLVLIDSTGDTEWRMAHALAHLDLGHAAGTGAFTAQQEADATGLAALRLDLLDDWAITL